MVPTCLLEAATLQKAVKPICTCGHSATFDPHGLWWHYKRRGWDDRLSAARDRFWCRVCRSRLRRKVRPIRLDLVKPGPLDLKLPWPDDRIWKREMARVR